MAGEGGLRQVQYRGGMVTFAVPDHWKEEAYRDGGASYYAGSAENGSLYLSMITARLGKAVAEADFRETANIGQRAGESPAELLPNGNYLRQFVRAEPTDRGVRHTTFWMVSNRVPPDTVRIATFTFGLPEQDAGSEEHRATVAMLDEQIRQAEFTTLTVEEIKDAIRRSRPWWKFW